jgi:hypothetical protein
MATWALCVRFAVTAVFILANAGADNKSRLGTTLAPEQPATVGVPPKDAYLARCLEGFPNCTAACTGLLTSLVDDRAPGSGCQAFFEQTSYFRYPGLFEQVSQFSATCPSGTGVTAAVRPATLAACNISGARCPQACYAGFGPLYGRCTQIARFHVQGQDDCDARCEDEVCVPAASFGQLRQGTVPQRCTECHDACSKSSHRLLSSDFSSSIAWKPQ